MIVVVTGGRNYQDRALVGKVLDSLKPSLVVQGGALGADRAALNWAMDDCPYLNVPALWDLEGKKAGPSRNHRMLLMATDFARARNEPLLLVYFPGGIGTAHCIATAKAMGIECVNGEDWR